MLWAQILGRKALSPGTHLSYWVPPQPPRPTNLGSDSGLDNNENQLCIQYGPDGPALMGVSCPCGVSSVDSEHHIQPCKTSPMDCHPECSPPENTSSEITILSENLNIIPKSPLFIDFDVRQDKI